MKITLKRLNHQPSASLIELMNQKLSALGSVLRIDEARIWLERQWEVSPPFRVRMHLVTPGPDVQADASDHTLRAAMIKAFEALWRKVEHRHVKRAKRGVETHVTSTSRQMPASPGRR